MDVYDDDKTRPSLLNDDSQAALQDKLTPKTQRSRNSLPAGSEVRAVRLKDGVPKSRFDPLNGLNKEHSLDLQKLSQLMPAKLQPLIPKNGNSIQMSRNAVIPHTNGQRSRNNVNGGPIHITIEKR